MKRKNQTNILIHLFFISFSILCLIPLMLVISASFSSEYDLARTGFKLIPEHFDLSAYQYLFANPQQIIDAYAVTIFITVVGTIGGLWVMSMMAYALSRSNFKFKKIFTYLIFFPTLFGGGLVPSYILNTQYYHLVDSLWVMILPGLIAPFQIIMLRTFFKQLPDGLFEAAKLDGASEFGILARIALPLSTPVLATVGFLSALGKWNSWYGCLLYIRDEQKFTLQYLLQRLMKDIEAVKLAMEYVPTDVVAADLPTENLRMAMVIVAIGPMLLSFPFFQKYFTKGMTVGAIKE